MSRVSAWKKFSLLAGTLAILGPILLSGCYAENGEPLRTVTYPDRTINDSNLSLHGNMRIVVDDASRTFDNVMMCFYDENSNTIDSENLGSFTTPDDIQTVNITVEAVPKYIVIYHPDFHEIEGFDKGYLRLGTDGFYHLEFPENNSGLEYPDSATPGEC